jgi:hypothetical protein
MNSNMPTAEQNIQAVRELREADRNVDAFKWNLFQKWVDTRLPQNAALSSPDYLYAAWLDGYQTGYDHAY